MTTSRFEVVLQEVAEEAANMADPADRMRLGVRKYVRYCADHPEHARIMVQESYQGNPRLSWAEKQHIVSRRTLMED